MLNCIPNDTRLYPIIPDIFSGFNFTANSKEFFTCKNGAKIDLKKKCNNRLDCKWTRPINEFDVSDEEHCCKFPIAFVFL